MKRIAPEYGGVKGGGGRSGRREKRTIVSFMGERRKSVCSMYGMVTVPGEEEREKGN